MGADSRLLVDGIPVNLQRRVWSLVVVGYQVNVSGREVCLQIFNSRLGGVRCHVTLFITCDFDLIKFSLLKLVDQEALIRIDAHRYLPINCEILIALLYVIEGNEFLFTAEASGD